MCIALFTSESRIIYCSQIVVNRLRISTITIPNGRLDQVIGDYGDNEL